MYDPYSEPNYNPGGGGAPQQPQGFQMPQINMPSFGNSDLGGPSIDIKKFIPIIIVVLIVAIIGFAVLFWLGMQHTITVNLTDTDGNELEGTLIVKDLQGNTLKVMTPKTGIASTFTGTLMEGDYALTANVTGYNKASIPIKVTSGTNTFDIKISKDLDATLNMTLDNAQIYYGQTISGKLAIQNNGEEFALSDIISASSANIEAKIITPSSDKILSGSTTLDFNAKIKSATPLTQKTTASIQFKIKGSSVISEKVDLPALPVVLDTQIEITPSGKITVANLVAGTRSSLKIAITNKNTSFPVENVLLTINTDNSQYANNLEWLEFNQSIANHKNSILIDTIPPKGGKAEVTLYITPQIDSKVNDAFIGYLSVTSYSISSEKNPDVEFKVATAKTSKVDIIGLTSPFSIACNKTTQTCAKNYLSNGEVKIKNSGSTEIRDINFEINLLSPITTANCQRYVTRFISADTTTPFKATKSSLKPGEEMEVIMDITPTFEEPDSHSVCAVKLTYIDELDLTQTITKTDQIEINKTGMN